MSTAVLSLFGTVTALVAGAWAGLLVMVNEGPGASAATGTRPSPSGELVLRGRVTRISRIALLFVAGVAASEAVGWWYQPFGAGLGRAALALALLYLIAEGLPRSAAVLMPNLAAALDPIARLTLSPFTPLVGVATTIEAWIESILPVPARSAGGLSCPRPAGPGQPARGACRSRCRARRSVDRRSCRLNPQTVEVGAAR